MSSFAGDLAYRVVKEKLGALIQAASGSPSLRAQLVANPKQAVEDFLGLTLPAGVKVRAIEEDADDAYDCCTSEDAPVTRRSDFEARRHKRSCRRRLFEHH